MKESTKKNIHILGEYIANEYGRRMVKAMKGENVAFVDLSEKALLISLTIMHDRIPINRRLLDTAVISQLNL